MNELEKAAQRQYNKTWHQNNKDKRRRYNDAAKKRIKEYVLSIKLSSSCNTCGESHPAILDFHHRNPDDKLFDISLAYQRGLSIEKLDKEIEKCDIICANCHRKLHWNERQNE